MVPLVLFLVVVLLGPGGPTESRYSIKKVNESTGLYYEKIGNAKIYHNFWKIVTYLDLGNYESELNTIHSYYEQTNYHCNLAKSQNISAEHCPLMKSTIYAEINNLVEQNELIQQLLGINSRPKRGLVNVVGSTSKTLFGTLDDSDAQYYNSQIEQLKNNQSHLLTLIRQQTSILESTVHVLNDTENNQHFYHYLENNLNKISSAFNTFVNESLGVEFKNRLGIHINSNVIVLSILLGSFRIAQNNLIDIVSLAERGILHPLILSPQQILEELSANQKYLTNLYFPLALKIENIQIIYNTAKINIFFVDNKLSFVIHLPLVELRVYDVLKISSIPSQIEKSEFSIIVPQQPYVVIDKINHYYFYLSESELSKCKDLSEHYICEQRKPIYRSPSTHDCEINFLTVNSKSFDKCDERIVNIKESLFIQIAQPNSFIFAVPSEEYLHLNCDFEKTETTITLNGTGILRINPSCQAYTKSISLTTHNVYKSKISVVYIPKLNLSLNLNDPIVRSNTFYIPEVPSSLVVSTNNQEINNLGRRVQELKVLGSLKDAYQIHYSITYSLIVLIIVGIALYYCIPKISIYLKWLRKTDVQLATEVMSENEFKLQEQGDEGKLEEKVEVENHTNPRYNFQA